MPRDFMVYCKHLVITKTSIFLFQTGEITTTDLNIAENVVWQSEEVLNVCKSEIGT